jgi:hypothetical protein
MSNKSISIDPNPRNKPPVDANALDAFVHGVASESTPKTPMKRLTFDIPADLHKRIRRTCLDRDVEMAVELRRLLQEHFPPRSTVEP